MDVSDELEQCMHGLCRGIIIKAHKNPAAACFTTKYTTRRLCRPRRVPNRLSSRNFVNAVVDEVRSLDVTLFVVVRWR